MKALVYGTVVKNQDKPFIRQMISSIQELDFEVATYAPYHKQYKENDLEIGEDTISTTLELSDFNPDLVISLGGDGTILNAMTLIKDLNIPILGINLGRLGFLANAEKSKIHQSLLKVKNGDYTIEKRTMLSLISERDLFEDSFGLNDFTIHRRDNSSMILIHCYINGELLNSYWADGLIVSTPTGSTSYSLSVGGPIITPECGNFVIAPVAPHNLNARPVVVSDDVEIKLNVEGRAENFLVTLDARHNTITEDDHLILKKCPYPARLLRLDNSSFFKTIHQKLMWGIDKRNV
jgi:NAD+ kinase